VWILCQLQFIENRGNSNGDSAIKSFFRGLAVAVVDEEAAARCS